MLFIDFVVTWVFYWFRIHNQENSLLPFTCPHSDSLLHDISLYADILFIIYCNCVALVLRYYMYRKINPRLHIVLWSMKLRNKWLSWEWPNTKSGKWQKA